MAMMNFELTTSSRASTPPPLNVISTVFVVATIVLLQVVSGMRSQVAILSRRGLHSIRRQGLLSSATSFPPSGGEIRTQLRRSDPPYCQIFDPSFRLFSNSQFETVSSEIVEEEEHQPEPDSDEEELIGSISSDENHENDDFRTLPNGSSKGFFVVQTYKTSESGFDMDTLKSIISEDDIKRLELKPENVSVPVAMMILDPKEFPTISRARKACRKAHIMIHRGPLKIDEITGKDLFDPKKCLRARVGDRIFPGGNICCDVRNCDEIMLELISEFYTFQMLRQSRFAWAMGIFPR
jgi:hypothetical protein